MSVIPIVSIVGRSNSGKTTFLERLIPALRDRGYRVATIKHDAHGFQIDQPGKDTWRHAAAGAEAVAISSPDRVAVIRKVREEMGIDEVAALLGDVDLILTEGYKSKDKPKVEVLGFQDPTPLCGPEDDLVAQVGSGETRMGPLPYVNRNDASPLADLLAERFLN